MTDEYRLQLILRYLVNRCDLLNQEFKQHRDFFDSLKAPDLHEMILLIETHLRWEVYEEIFHELYELVFKRVSVTHL